MFDELKIFCGDDIQINSKITITQPTIKQIKNFGEQKYFSAVHTLTSVGADLKWQLWDMGIGYTKIDDFDLFITLTYRLVSSKTKLYEAFRQNPEKYKQELSALSPQDIEEMQINPLQLTFKDIDFADFEPCEDKTHNQVILYNAEKDIAIDRPTYRMIVDAVRQIHYLKRNNERPANERAKMDDIEDAREEAMMAKNRDYKSVLKPLMSALSVECGLLGDDRLENLKINRFLKKKKRKPHIQNANFLLQGAYSGFGSIKGIDKDKLNWAATEI